MANLLLSLLAFAASVFLLRALRPVLVPFLLASLLFYLFDPLVARMSGRLPRALSISVVLLAFAALLAGAGLVARHGLSTIASDAPRYERKLAELRERLSQRVGGGLGRTPGGEELRKKLGGGAATAAGGLLKLGGELVLVFAYLAFLLAGSPRSRERWRRAFPQQAERVIGVQDELGSSMTRFIALQSLVSLVQAASAGLILFIHGVPLAGFWTLLNFISQFVPNVGPIVASVPPVLMALAEGPPAKALSAAFWLLLSQVVIGNFLEPRVMGRGMHLDPVVVLLGIMFFGWLWGVFGALLAVPMLVAAKTLSGKVERLKPLASLLEGAQT